jgi:uncharacterized membrane protein YphA (DoxX/SURF4 family)
VGDSPVVVAAVYVAAVALIVTGLAKLRDPVPTALALNLVGLPSRRPWVWGLAAVELVVGVAVTVHLSPITAGALGFLYLSFTVFLFGAMRAGASCGCIGGADHPPGWLHVALDLAAAVAGFAVAIVR